MPNTYTLQPFDIEATKFEISSWREVVESRANPEIPSLLIDSHEAKSLGIMQRAHEAEQEFLRCSQIDRGMRKRYELILIMLTLCLCCPVFVLVMPAPFVFRAGAGMIAIIVAISSFFPAREAIRYLREPNPFVEHFHESQIIRAGALSYMRGFLEAYCILHDERREDVEPKPSFH